MRDSHLYLKTNGPLDAYKQSIDVATYTIGALDRLKGGGVDAGDQPL